MPSMISAPSLRKRCDACSIVLLQSDARRTFQLVTEQFSISSAELHLLPSGN